VWSTGFGTPVRTMDTTAYLIDGVALKKAVAALKSQKLR
jgi:hypothetical protein